MLRSILFGITLYILITPLSTIATDMSRTIIYDVPQSVMERQFGRMPASQLTRQDSLDTESYRFTARNFRLLAVLVDWFNRPGTYTVEDFENMLFSRGTYPGGSVADYFAEVSFGHLDITGDVYDWYMAGNYDPVFYFQSILPVVDMYVDFSQYDGDNNGYVDGIVFIRSGNGQEDSGDPNDIWSYAVSYPPGYSLGPYDGVYISRFNTTPETRPLRNPENPNEFLGVDEFNRIRVFAHELSHNMGLPDLYDYDAKLEIPTYTTPGDDNDHPFVDWCLMGYYGYGILSIGSEVPSHLSGWCKQEIGWVTPILLDGIEYIDLVINNIETTRDNSLYQIPINTGGSEYFLLEYRNPHSLAQYDKLDSDFSAFLWPDLTYGCDTLDRGLLITHVDGSISTVSQFNNGTPVYPHYAVAVEDAGYNPDMDFYSNPEGRITDSAQWWYPYETRRAALFSDDVPGQELFSPNTTPSSDGYYGPSGIYVIVDSIVDDKLYAYVAVDADLDDLIGSEDNCPTDYNPDQTDIDIDGHGDICDNCPYFYNPEQLDSNQDNIGDVCTFTAPMSEGYDIIVGLGDDLVLNFDNISASGSIEMTMAVTGPEPLSFTVIPATMPIYYDISTDASYEGNIEICMTYDDAGLTALDEQSLGLLHYDGIEWINITSSIDNATNTICGQTLSLSEFVTGIIDFICADVDNDNIINILDIVYLINYLYKSGSAPIPIMSGDVNNDGSINILDIVFVINFIYKNGPMPVCPVG